MPFLNNSKLHSTDFRHSQDAFISLDTAKRTVLRLEQHEEGIKVDIIYSSGQDFFVVNDGTKMTFVGTPSSDLAASSL